MINIAKLLKYVPKGWKLYSPLFGEVNFVGVDKQSDYPINVTDCKGNGKSFTEFGVYFADHPDAECLLFPSKDCRTWEGWKLPIEPKFKFKVVDWIVQNDNGTVSQITKTINRRDEYGEYRAYEHTNGYFAECFEDEYHLWTIKDAKDGDVLATDNGWTCIFKAFDGRVFSSYCFMDSQKWFCEFGSEAHTLDSRINGNIHPATKEQRDLLFAKMKEAGYEWDEKKKELRKIKPHYDIKNFHVGMPVLVRADNDCSWDYSVFSRNTGNEYWPFAVCNGVSFTQCIPFNEDTKHLLGTTDMPSEEYINW